MHASDLGRRDAPAIDSHVEAYGHDQVGEVTGVWGFEQARAQGADQLQDQLLGVDALEPIAQELRVEANLERLAVEGHWDRLAGLTNVWGLRWDGQRYEETTAELQSRDKLV